MVVKTLLVTVVARAVWVEVLVVPLVRVSVVVATKGAAGTVDVTVAFGTG